MTNKIRDVSREISLHDKCKQIKYMNRDAEDCIVGSRAAEREQGDAVDDKVWITYAMLRKKKQPQV